MKNNICLLALALFALACTSPKPEPVTEPKEDISVTLPYEATYTTSFNQDVSDADLLTVLNSYKAWELGDMTMLRATLADTIMFDGWDGTKYSGPAEGLLSRWTTSRDSLSRVRIEFAVWQKSHAIDKNEDYIDVWYREVDTYKSGKVDSADWHDINRVHEGKIVWYAQYKRAFKKN